MALTTAEKYTSTAKKTERYSDVTAHLGIHPGKKDLLRITNEKAVKRSIVNLLKTDYHERLYQPMLGANLKYLLFEPATEDTLSLIKDQVLSCIAKFEPRAHVLNISVKYSSDEHSVSVSLVFAINNQSNPITLDLVLSRVR